MKISNVHIVGGNQQFADVIINRRVWKELSEKDRLFVEFIAQEANSQQKSQDLADIIEGTYNNDKRTTENKNKLASVLIENKDRVIAFSKQVGKAALVAILVKFGLKLLDIGIE